MARIKSSLWVSAYLQRVARAGAQGFILHRGDANAGAILVKLNPLDSTALLFSGRHIGSADPEFPELWELRQSAAPEQIIDKIIAAERRFDPDLWAIETEDKAGRSFLPGIDLEEDAASCATGEAWRAAEALWQGRRR